MSAAASYLVLVCLILGLWRSARAHQAKEADAVFWLVFFYVLSEVVMVVDVFITKIAP